MGRGRRGWDMQTRGKYQNFVGEACGEIYIAKYTSISVQNFAFMKLFEVKWPYDVE